MGWCLLASLVHETFLETLTKRCVPMVILSPVKFTLKIDHPRGHGKTL